ncbi:hypothetical protein [Deefgea rivuli]|uniref:hypothetical protein n=1 Tax=Deefgea rivuli TaxID=400948 RepID=UPI0012EBCFBF|nr:hypothetical protein [Deefgea rivuli]
MPHPEQWGIFTSVLSLSNGYFSLSRGLYEKIHAELGINAKLENTLNVIIISVGTRLNTQQDTMPRTERRGIFTFGIKKDIKNAALKESGIFGATDVYLMLGLSLLSISC